MSIFFLQTRHTSIDSTFVDSRGRKINGPGQYESWSYQRCVQRYLNKLSIWWQRVAALHIQGEIDKIVIREIPGEKTHEQLFIELCPIQDLFTQPTDPKLNGDSMSSVRKSLQLPSSKSSKINRINTSWSQLVAHWPAWRRGMPEIASWGCFQACISRK